MKSGLQRALGAVSLVFIATGALAEDHVGGDPEKGAKVFKKCKACHSVGEGAKHKIGPSLNNVIGRTAGTAAEFKYGPSMIAAGEMGLVWDEETIAAFVENPKKYLQAYLDDKKAKTKMTIKVKKEEDRANVAAYLATFSSEPEAEGEGETASE